MIVSLRSILADILIFIHKYEKQMQRYFKGRMGQSCKRCSSMKLKDQWDLRSDTGHARVLFLSDPLSPTLSNKPAGVD